jgi:ADP-heptose:LPS heptosyltransferase
MIAKMPQTPANFYQETREARKIVVVDLGFLGDTVHLAPALWEIRDHYPRAELHVVTTPLGGEVLELARCVDRCWLVNLDPKTRRLREQLNTIAALRREKFDVAISFNGTDRAIILLGLAGARRSVAQKGGRWHFWSGWLVRCWVPRQEGTLPVFEQRRSVLAACGFTLGPARFDLGASQVEMREAEGTVPPGAVHLSLNSANPLKEWPVSYYIELIGHLLEARPHLHIIASASNRPRERERLDQFMAGASSRGVKALPAGLSILQLAAVLKRCHLHFGPDSGVMHLALAMGTPTVSIFRDQGNYREWLPPAGRHQHFLASCRCIDRYDCPCASAGQAECLLKISPAEVAGRIMASLRSCEPPASATK